VDVDNPIVLDVLNKAYGLAAGVGVILPFSRRQELEAKILQLLGLIISFGNPAERFLRNPRNGRISFMKILVVEDEKGVAGFIKKGLEEETYTVDVASDGEDGLAFVSVNQYDLIILDIMLPGISGIEVCKRMRQKGIETPIMMLTARDSVTDKVLGLDSGADDYLTKPFMFG